jgi:hypothetical protein
MRQTQLVAALAGLATASTALAGATAVEWKVSDGGNGHWYALYAVSQVQICWADARANAIAVGGDLLSLNSAEEAAFLATGLELSVAGWTGAYQDFQAPDYAEPAGGWRWSDGTTWDNSVVPWFGDGPSDSGGIEHWMTFDGKATNDLNECWWSGPNHWLVEWSADCNGDGIVDYGQILSGELPDGDGNGVPDNCGACTGDFNGDRSVDAADLSILLGYWGSPPSGGPGTDLNADGSTDASDLAVLLSAWGSCP